MTTFIYALTDPRTGEIRYIGLTGNLKQRFAEHLSDARCGGRAYRCRWIRSLLKCGIEPSMMLLQVCDGDGCAEEREHIAKARTAGRRLTNWTDGGEDGCRHKPKTAEQKARISAGLKASPRARAALKRLNESPEFQAKRIAACRDSAKWQAARQKMTQAGIAARQSPEGRAWASEHWQQMHTPEARRKQADALRGRKLSPERVEKRVAKMRGKKQTPEHVEKRIAKVRGCCSAKKAAASAKNIQIARAAAYTPEVNARRAAATWAARKANSAAAHRPG